MAISADRRMALRAIAAAALLPCMGSRLLAADTPARPFSPPHSPMRYSRLLERPLPGGYAIRVERAFEVGFTHRGNGFLLGGRQIAVEVEMPDPLKALADLERQRDETGLFPMELDGHGLIEHGPALKAAEELDRATAIVRAGIADAPRNAADKAQLSAYLDRLHAASATMAATLPADLFAPPSAPRTVSRELSLPGGLAGVLSVRFAAERDPATGLMREAYREIVTSIGQDDRISRESWSLGPA